MDMASTIVPKSDQLNADDLIAGPKTIKITDVAIRGGQEQPVSIYFEGDNGKPYKACKSMCRVMVSAWGADSKKYVGRSMTLFREPTVKWGGLEVGGIRISHMSDIEAPLTLALTVTRGSRKPYIVRPLEAKGNDFTVDLLTSEGKEYAEKGTAAYAAWWGALTPADRKAIGTAKHEQMKAIAAAVAQPEAPAA